jgi:hypothetical protein
VAGIGLVTIPAGVRISLEGRKQGILSQVHARNAKFLESETEKLDAWASDVKLALDRELKELDREIREAKRAAKLEGSLEGKLAGKRRVKALEGMRNAKRKSLFEAQDKVEKEQDDILDSVERQLTQSTRVERLFQARWRIV